MSRLIRWTAAAGIVAAFIAMAARLRELQPDPLPEFPRLMLWAWERPERMPFLDPSAAGVAFLSRTVSWNGGVTTSLPRLQPLQVPPATALMAVVRLESGGGEPPDAGAVVAELLRSAKLPGIRAMQVDFDARRSEREWYRRLQARLRAELPPSMPLEVTALASWCQGDRWIESPPVADAVPMLFRMGAGESWAGGDFHAEVCRSSVGVSTDELPRAIPHGRRLFVFNPRPWTAENYRGALQLERKWR